MKIPLSYQGFLLDTPRSSVKFQDGNLQSVLPFRVNSIPL